MSKLMEQLVRLTIEQNLNGTKASETEVIERAKRHHRNAALPPEVRAALAKIGGLQ